MSDNGDDRDHLTPSEFALACAANKEPCRVLSNLTMALHAIKVEVSRTPHPIGKRQWRRVVSTLGGATRDLKVATGLK